MRGHGFTAASGSATNNSATNYPLVQLRSLESEQTRWLPPGPAAPFSNTAFTSQPVSDCPSGYTLVTAFERHPQYLQIHPDPGPAAVLFDLPAAGPPLISAGAEDSSWEQEDVVSLQPSSPGRSFLGGAAAQRTTSRHNGEQQRRR